MQQWDVQAATGRCHVSGEAFKEGEEFYAVLYEDGESFVRRDYSLAHWNGPPPDAFCHFRSRVPMKHKPRQLLVNNAMLLGFFDRLANESEPVRIQFRFVLALLLLRKRLLRYEGTRFEDGREIWDMTTVHDKSSHQVVNPRLSDDQIAAVSQQLGAILHSDMGEWAASPTGPQSSDAGSGETEDADAIG